MPSRRRPSTTPGPRRPRVAGLPAVRAAEQSGPDRPADRGTTVVDTRPAPRPETVEPCAPVPPVVDDPADDLLDDTGGVADRTDAAEPVADAPAAGEPGADEPARGGRLAALGTVPVLAALLAVLVALSAFFVIGTITLRSTPAQANVALTDIAGTSEVITQLGDAVELIYSYDFARLDENERAARDVISPAFAEDFGPLFDQIREIAPQVRAVVSATVTNSAVQSLDGDRAVLVVFMDQQATTVGDGQQTGSQGRLTVTGVRIDGRWKVDAVESR